VRPGTCKTAKATNPAQPEPVARQPWSCRFLTAPRRQTGVPDACVILRNPDPALRDAQGAASLSRGVVRIPHPEPRVPGPGSRIPVPGSRMPAHARDYSTFCTCSRIFSSSALSETTTSETAGPSAFDPTVFTSRFISWSRKSSLRPHGSGASDKARQCSR
jgi:hypothetical protein